MKKALTIIVIVILIIIFNLSLLSCGIETGTTTSSITAKIENSTVAVDIENQSRINDFNNRLYEWGKFFIDYLNATQKIDQDIADLDNKRMEALEKKDYEKAKACGQVQIDKNEEAINNLSKIYVPEIAKDFYSYGLDHYVKYKQWHSYILTLSNNFDVSKANSLKDEADTASIKAIKEGERIVKGFNQEAQELGLTMPFPNL